MKLINLYFLIKIKNIKHQDQNFGQIDNQITNLKNMNDIFLNPNQTKIR